MSHGFLTESALLPSKSKKIKVDGNSLLGLKALVYEKEQKILAEKSADKSYKTDIRALRGKHDFQIKEEIEHQTRKDVFSRENRGVSKRNSTDQKALSIKDLKRREREEKCKKSLIAKAKVYEKIAKGELQNPDGSGLLVNFAEKTQEEIERLNSKEEAGLDSSEEVEIEDEFGRNRVVKKSSKLYKEYLDKKKSDSSPIRGKYGVRYGSDPWSWDDGKTNRYKNSEEDSFEGRSHMKTLFEDHYNKDDGRVTSFRLKDRWDTKLNQEGKNYIHELRDEGGNKKIKRDIKKERLELLHKKN
mmetsp:Transcript_696/g.1006  ORF Transcript_696/g.1006 Transcript_696/m.1006 type:complete len:301 (+) Transcript_696:42-944(+)